MIKFFLSSLQTKQIFLKIKCFWRELSYPFYAISFFIDKHVVMIF